MILRTAALAAASIGAALRDSVKRRGVPGTLRHVALNCFRVARYARFRFREAAYDSSLGVNTRGYVDLTDLGIDPSKLEGVSRSKTGYAYQATPAWLLTRILEKLKLDYRSYVFLDLGSGMGRAVMMAAEFPFARIAGVELSPSLHQIARENLRKWKSRKQRCEAVELVCMDALEYPLPLSNTVLYMFNPFTEASMRPLLERVATSLRESPREMYIIYVNPVLKGLLEESGYLETVMTGELFAVYRARRQ